KKLCCSVELVTIPRALPPHSDFWKPLSAQHKIALPSCARLRLRQLIVEYNFELHIRTGRNRLRYTHVHDGLVILVAIIRLDELQVFRQISLPHHFKAFDLFRTVFCVLPLRIVCVAITDELGFAHPRCLGLESVQIKMKRKMVEGLPS